MSCLLLCACVWFVAPDTVRADPAIEGAAQRIFQRIMSPYCPGLQLAACPSSKADELRNEIRAELTAGRSSDAIEADLHRRFGDGTRTVPRMSGLGLVAWIVPLVTFIAGGLLLMAWLRRSRAPGPDSGDAATLGAAPAPGAHDALNQRLDDELADL